MTLDTTEVTGHESWLASGDATAGREVDALVLAWSLTEPERVGEVALLPDLRKAYVLGRGGPQAEDEAPRVAFVKQRPGGGEPGGPLEGARISRRQLSLEARGGTLTVSSVGRCPLLVNGRLTTQAELTPGDTLTLERQLVLLYERRAAWVPSLESWSTADDPTWGGPDRFGIVGESEATWALRDRLAFVGRRSKTHVLLTGESGTGKELAARALHGLSDRRRPLVARNAATLPEGLIDAELFGNVSDYPNPGMRARPGLIGEADGSTLFLDEIGELPEALQAHLLRVLDSGEYHRLGEARARSVDLRLIAATNRDPESLKHDLAARLTLRVEVPGLGCRRADIALLIAHVLGRIAADDPEMGERFFEGWNGRGGRPRVAPELVERLLRHRFTHHVRELETLLWRAMAESSHTFIALGPEVEASLSVEVTEPRQPGDLTPDEIRAALERNDGNQARTWRELGLRNRDVLYRLIKKHGIAVRRSQEPT